MPDGSQLEAALSAPPNLRKTTAVERSSKKPIVVEIYSSGGPRYYYLGRIAQFKEDFLRAQTYQTADGVFGASAGATLVAGLTTPCPALGGRVPVAEYLQPILLESGRKILSLCPEFDRKNWMFVKPYSSNRAQAVLRSHWGDATLCDAKTGVAIFAQSSVPHKKKPMPHMFTNMPHKKGHPDFSHVPVYEAVSAAIAMPGAFKATMIEGYEMYDGAFRRAFPLKQAYKFAEYLRGDSDRPIILIGITAGFSEKVSKMSKWIQGTTPREQINKQKKYFEGLMAKGGIDPASFVIDLPADQCIRRIGESFTDISNNAVKDMVAAADVTFARTIGQWDHLRSRLGMTAEI